MTQNEKEIEALEEIMNIAMSVDLYPEKSAELLRDIIDKAQSVLPPSTKSTMLAPLPVGVEDTPKNRARLQAMCEGKSLPSDSDFLVWATRYPNIFAEILDKIVWTPNASHNALMWRSEVAKAMETYR